MEKAEPCVDPALLGIKLYHFLSIRDFPVLVIQRHGSSDFQLIINPHDSILPADLLARTVPVLLHNRRRERPTPATAE